MYITRNLPLLIITTYIYKLIIKYIKKFITTGEFVKYIYETYFFSLSNITVYFLALIYINQNMSIN